jgi:hypothetical protein
MRTGLITQAPEVSLTPWRRKLDAVFTAVIAAPGTTAPLASVTRPSIEAASRCANSGQDAAMKIAIESRLSLIESRNILSPPGTENILLGRLHILPTSGVGPNRVRSTHLRIAAIIWLSRAYYLRLCFVLLRND